MPPSQDWLSGAQVGDRAGAAAGRVQSPVHCAAMSGPPGGAEQETSGMTVPGGTATWKSGPVTRFRHEGQVSGSPGQRKRLSGAGLLHWGGGRSSGGGGILTSSIC
ncbi:UNVERIFIED_CONTAM: hypothetical protein FKN15_044592 [Acipenser sinensis]